MRGNVVQNESLGVGSEVISGSFVGDGTKEFPISLSVSRLELMQRTAICIFTTDWNGSFPEEDEIGMLISFCGLIPDDLMNYSEIIGNAIWVDFDPGMGPFFNTDGYLHVTGSPFSPPVTFELETTLVFKDGATYHYVIW